MTSTRVPDTYKALASSGQRVRFNGFWLGESQQDRTLAEWIDATPQAATIIKARLYAWIVGADTAAQTYTPEQPASIGKAGSALLSIDD